MQKTMDESEQKRIFDEWLKQYKGLFFKVVRAFAFNLHDQDDLFQEISIQIWHSILNFRGDSSVSTWIYRVALYAATAWSRQERKHRDNKQPLAGIEHTLVQSRQMADGRLDWLYEQIAQLNEIDRSLILLLLEGFNYQEMAVILGISQSNVGVKIHRIKKHLAQKSQEMIQNGV